MTEFLLLAGTHQEGGVRYDVPRGAQPVRVISDQPLDEKFPNKFQQIEGSRLTTDASVPTGEHFLGRPAPVIGSREGPILRVADDLPAVPPIKNPMSPPPAEKEEETAADVTAEYPDAGKYGLKVLRRRTGLVLIDGNAGRNDAVLTTATSKTQMHRAIERAARTRLPA